MHNIGNAYYIYDANGRLSEKRENKKGFRPQSWRYQWDSEDQLTQVTLPDGEQWQYAYDPFGRRIQKTKTQNGKGYRPPAPGYERPIRQGSAYQWDGDRLIQEAPVYADGTVAWDQAETWHYEANSFRPIAKEQNGKLFYIVTDHLGTPREMLDEAGIPVWRAKFSVWGELLDKEAPNDPDYGRQSCNLRFQGQQYDPETGLHYNRYRYYDPTSAQYLSPDPIGLAGGLTPQAYVHDPNQWVDPLGLNPFYRGAKAGNSPAFSPRPSDYKVDTSGFVKPTHGVSVFDNPDSVSSKGFEPHEIKPETVPDSLQIKQRGQDSKHYEIMPKEEGTLTESQYKDELGKIECKTSS